MLQLRSLSHPLSFIQLAGKRTKFGDAAPKAEGKDPGVSSSTFKIST